MKRKEEMIRQEAMEYAYRIVKNEGIEALASRCRRNAETYVPSRLEEGPLEEFVQRTKSTCMFTFMAAMIFTLHTKFGYGQQRMERILGEFVELSDSLYFKWLTFEDVVRCIKEETGVDLSPYMPLAYKTMTELDEQIEREGDNFQPGV